MSNAFKISRRYLVASDFDQTLSFHDSGLVLSELAGIPAEVFERRIAMLAIQNLVQQGGELAYLLHHDPEFGSQVIRDHLLMAGKGASLEHDIEQLSRVMESGLVDFR